MTDGTGSTTGRDERRLAAIVSLDVVGYSRLMGQDESGTLAALKSHRRELVDRKVAEHHGRIVKTMGDGLLLEFASVVDAVRCAVEIQRGMAERNTGIPEDRRIVLRIGIHVGDIIHDEDDIFGDGVNVAARIESLADPGGIAVSRSVRDQVLDKLGFAFEDLGAKQVKNIARPIEVYRVAFDGASPGALASAPSTAWMASRRVLGIGALALLAVALAGIGWTLLRPAPVVAPYSEQDRRMTFAVLPLDAPTGDAEARAVAAALTDELRAQQEARPDWARAVSRRSVDEAVARHASLKDIAKAVDARFLVRGSVSRKGAGYHAHVMVVDGATERVLFTRSLPVPAGPFSVAFKERLARAGGDLTFSAMEAEVERARAKPDAALDVRDLAFRAYVTWIRTKGRGEDKEAYTQAMALLDRAAALAPDDRLVLRLVAHVNICECVEGWSRNVAEQQAIGAAALERLAAVSPSSPAVNEMRFDLAVAQGRYEDAFLAAEAVARLEPEGTSGQWMRAYSLLKLGRYDEALTAFRYVLAHRDLDGDHSLAASLLYALGRDDEAAQHAQKALLTMSADEKRSARYGPVALVLAAAEARQGRAARARQAVPAVRSVAQVRAWIHPAAELAGFEPLYDGLRRAGVPD